MDSGRVMIRGVRVAVERSRTEEGAIRVLVTNATLDAAGLSVRNEFMLCLGVS
jgi:hypothetical protein